MLRRQALLRVLDLCIALPLSWIGLRAIAPSLFRSDDATRAIVVGRRNALFRESKHIACQIGDMPAIIFDRPEGLVAFNLLCTHAQCVVRYEDEGNRFLCPCHGGAFDAQGNVTAEPPRRPLQRLFVSEHDGIVYLSNRVIA